MIRRALCLFLLLIALSVSLAQAAEVDVETRFGWYGSDSVRAMSGEPVRWNASVETGYTFWRMRLFTSIETMMVDFGSNGFSPARVNYAAGVSGRLADGLTMEYSHRCYHAVDADAEGYSVDLVELVYVFKGTVQ